MPRRRADKIDANQPDIVEALLKKGYSVEVGHDDILVGANGKTYWFEIKTGPKSEIKTSQTKLLDTWKGHYSIVWTAAMIIAEIEKDASKSN